MQLIIGFLVAGWPGVFIVVLLCYYNNCCEHECSERRVYRDYRDY